MNKNFYIEGDRPWFNLYPENSPKNLAYPEVPVFHYIDKHAAESPDSIALTFYDRDISYKEFKDLTDRFARALQEYGIQRGDRVMILAVNCPQNIISIYGCAKAGAVPVALNPLYTAKELEYFFKDIEPRLVITPDAFYANAVEAAKSTPQIERVITFNLSDYFSPIKKVLARLLKKIEVIKCPGSIDFNEFLKVSPEYNHPEIDVFNDPALIVYTGGTTGEPKGVVVTHYNMVSNAYGIHYWYNDYVGPKSFLLVVPIFHIYGAGLIMNWPFINKGRLVIFPKFHTKEIIDAIKKYRIDGLFGVPAIFSALINYFKENPKEKPLDFVKLVTSGSAPISAYTWQQGKETFPKASLIEGYGLSETCSVFLVDPLSKKYTKGAGMVGIPLLNMDVRIVDPHTNEELPVGESGEIVTKGPIIFKEYWRKPEKTAEAMQNGWFHTKDIGRINNEGAFSIEGRLDDMINVRGEKVWPREVEKVLEENPKVQEVAVIGVKDDYYGEKIKACVALKSNEKATEKELIDFCRAKLSPQKIPHMIEFYKELPKSNLGKILHYKLRQNP
jgi:long-chain acyl-CoA synthetase